MDEDEELAAIRAKLRAEMLGTAAAGTVEAPAPPAAPAALDHPVDVDDAGFAEFVRSHENVVVDCWAPWCGPCRIVDPIVKELAREMSGKVVFAKLNVDLNPAVSRTFGIQSIPTLMLFRKGRLVERLVGALPKPQLAAQIERHLGGRRSSGSPGPRRM